MTKTRVVHCKIEKFDIYIGRPGIWGNPYSHKQKTIAKYATNSVEESLEKYKEYIMNKPELLKLLPQIKNKTLGCWCKTSKNPNAPCHGDILVEIIEKL